jgi:hypothetical protein
MCQVTRWEALYEPIVLIPFRFALLQTALLSLKRLQKALLVLTITSIFRSSKTGNLDLRSLCQPFWKPSTSLKLVNSDET